MAEKIKNGYGECLKTKIGNATIYLKYGWDLKHGKGWFSFAYTDSFKIGFGFHKNNKLTAVRQSLNVA